MAKLYSSEHFKERLWPKTIMWPNYTALNILRSVCGPKQLWAKLYSSEYFKERLWPKTIMWPNYTALNILRSVCGQIIQL